MRQQKIRGFNKLAAVTVVLGCLFSVRAPAGTALPTRVLWDEWYTMTIGKKTHYGYYNDRAEERGDRLFFKNDVWKKEEQFTNRETIGTLAQNNDELTPLFFNFHSTYRLTETTIDGLVQTGSQLSVKIRRGTDESPAVKRSIPRKAYFSTLFPIWLGKRLASLKEGQAVHFEVIQEDSVDSGFSPVEGSARLEKPDETANKLHAKKLSVDYRGLRSIWWVDTQGAAYRIESPQQKLTIERAPKNTALHFLDGADASLVIPPAKSRAADTDQ